MGNGDKMRDAYAAYNRRDFSFVDELFVEDIDWRTPGPGGELRGRAAVKAFFGELTQQFTAHKITIEDSVESANGDRIVCFVRHLFTRPDGESGEVEAVHDWQFGDGQIVRLREIADTLAFGVVSGMLPAELLEQAAV